RSQPLSPGALAGTTHLLSSIAPDEAGDPVLASHRGDLAALPELHWAGYLSTTGVYGDAGGAWVDEDSPLRPTHERSRRRVAAEHAWLASGLPAEVFRLAGIYGPGRNLIEEVTAGRARHIVRPGQVFSRIHVADIAGALAAAMVQPLAGRVLNLADDEPAASSAVLEEACRLLGVAPPPPIPFEEAQASMSELALSFWADNRGVSNARLKQELGYRLRYPTYREGLRACRAAAPASPR
ncbi:MAG TPA: SDR family NAD(P)-dependent oxidoreductase, partial [Kiloniellales bacterium]|nr:SDR family NAD(P)-dependent oxidoreductase [Kiloniellales bacterium]